ncbi:hypothetical protein [Rhizobium leguminosarum]|uniref:hypothetical protein n=1 Tax=Rhizobium leguminosarum TaxID=384 RepID=UPI0013BDEFFD|nr:hypothetical protein [Rhizobium leguminosarum]MBY5325260.1 hypothetical protein [Rhizobium leguminosarum]MBY5381444.1 hypothetical protein [Rhizobium leguminosarum]MCA2432816.1 hypothetical protein [Rhizobium leguminosarum]NEH74720.1 hypothetical protein [Rhizobium leguminosarum]
MEVHEFLRLRTAFIRRHYETAAEPFRQIIRKIEAGEEPYEPPYSEDGEPPFLEEWSEAKTSLEILGATCVSMLSESLKLYFMTWERELGVQCATQLPDEFSRNKGKGFINGYKVCFGRLLRTDWSDCPADWDVIEQVALARNDAQHAKHIHDMGMEHNPKVRKKHPMPFFLSEDEKRMIEADQILDHPWFGLSLVVTHETLYKAIAQVESLTAWMEEPLFDVKYGRR